MSVAFVFAVRQLAFGNSSPYSRSQFGEVAGDILRRSNPSPTTLGVDRGENAATVSDELWESTWEKPRLTPLRPPASPQRRTTHLGTKKHSTKAVLFEK